MNIEAAKSGCNRIGKVKTKNRQLEHPFSQKAHQSGMNPNLLIKQLREQRSAKGAAGGRWR
jgi:hypothetical protein